MKIQLSIVAVTGLLLALVGCKSDSENQVSEREIIHDLSPELRGTVERPSIAHANAHITEDLNRRMFFDDIGRVLYTDHPSRLHPLPITGLNGLPR